MATEGEEHLIVACTLHQKVALAVDLRGKLHGYTELVIAPLSDELKTVYINCRYPNIQKVSIDGVGDAHFTHVDPCSATQGTYIPTDPAHVSRAFPELKRKLFSAINEASEGELAISLPPEIIRPAAQLDGVPPQRPTYEPIVMKIEYDCVNPPDGVRFAGMDCSGSPLPHAYTVSGNPDSARCWLPCLDDAKMRCTWDIELTVSAILSLTVGEDAVEDEHIIAIASGDLMEQVTHPSSSSQVIFRYSVIKPTSAQHIGFAVGPFKVYDFPSTQHLHAFYLPTHEATVECSLSFLPRAREAMIAEAGTYPFDDYKAVFVDDSGFTMPGSPVHNTASLTVFAGDVLHPAGMIEQAYDARQTIAHAMAQQWYGILVLPKSWEDTWLIVGLALRLSSLALRKLLGNNEYRYRLRKDIERCCAADVAVPPLCQIGRPTPLSADELAFVSLKAPLVLHCLDRQLLKSGASVGLTRVLNQLSNSIVAEALKGNLLSTHAFFRICRKLTRNDTVRAFAQQWVFSSGCPRFHITREFDRKRMCIYVTMRQESPAWDYLVTSPSWTETAHLRPVQIFEGQMTIRIHEADGTAYEHVLDIRDPEKRHDVPFNTKYKRVRRGDTEAREDVTFVDPSFDYPPWEDEKERIRWRVHDWTDEQIKEMETATFEWIRLDADFEWICTIVHEQPAEQWISQIQSDRDVIAQLDAVQGLARIPNKVVASHLCKTVLVTNYFYRIRMEAAYALMNFCTPELGFLGIIYLVKIFQSRFCFPPITKDEEAFDYTCLPKPNDFSDLAEYHLQKALIVALSQLRAPDGRPYDELQQLLIGLLRYNDNGRNRYDDSVYLSTIIAALSHSLVPPAVPDANEFVIQEHDLGIKAEILGEAVIEIDRYLSMDRLVPSYRNVVTVAALEFKAKVMLLSLWPLDLQVMVDYTREGNYPAVRSAAFDCLLLTQGMLNEKVAEYVFEVIRGDEAPLVSRHLAQSVLEWLLAYSISEDLGALKEESGFLEIDENGMVANKPTQGSTERGRIVDSLKTQLGKLKFVRVSVLSMLLMDKLDITIRMTLVKLCDILFNPRAEPLPKLKLRVSLGQQQQQQKHRRGPRLFSSAFPGLGGAPAAPAAGANGFLPTLPAQNGAQSPEVPIIRLPVPKPKRGGPRAPKVLDPNAMSDADRLGCRALMKKISSHKKGLFFRVPVDPVRDKAPGYFDIVTHPMDLSTINHKLTSGVYRNRHELRADFKLIVDNAIRYNGEASRVAEEARGLDHAFEKMWHEVERMIANHQAGRRTAGDPPAPLSSSSIYRPVPSTSDAPLIPPPASSPPISRPALKLKLKPTVTFAEKPLIKEATPVPTDKDSQDSPTAEQSPPVARDGSPVVPLPPKKRKSEEDGEFVPQYFPTVPRPALSTSTIQVAPPKPKKERPPISTVAGPTGDLQVVRSRQILQKIIAMQESYFFREAVPETFADYHAKIARPMDLGTITKKLEDGQYSSSEELDADFKLMATNCSEFNEAGSVAVAHMNTVLRAWADEWRKADAAGKQERKRNMRDAIKQLMSEPSAGVFMAAVDPVALGIPHYFDVIKPEDARDLTSISKKANDLKYATYEDLDADLALMARNALTFNREGDPVHSIALAFDEARKRIMEPLLTGTTDERPSKKVRIV